MQIFLPILPELLNTPSSGESILADGVVGTAADTIHRISSKILLTLNTNSGSNKTG
jgi:hypothetical protein